MCERIFCYHFGELDTLYESLLSEAKSLNFDHVKVSAFGAEFDGFLSKQQIVSKLETEGVDDPTTQARVQAVVLNLKPDDVDRLMYVGTLNASCKFSRPTTKAKRYLDIDRQLNKKGLVEIKPDPVAYEQLKKDVENQNNGHPISCYQMTLADEGFNVKTTLVKTLGMMFKGNANNPRIAMK